MPHRPASTGIWIASRSLAVGDRVKVVVEISSISEMPVVLHAAARGYIIEVDSEGDIQIFFPFFGRAHCEQWIEGADSSSLAVLRPG